MLCISFCAITCCLEHILPTSIPARFICKDVCIPATIIIINSLLECEELLGKRRRYKNQQQKCNFSHLIQSNSNTLIVNSLCLSYRTRIIFFVSTKFSSFLIMALTLQKYIPFLSLIPSSFLPSQVIV